MCPTEPTPKAQRCVITTQVPDKTWVLVSHIIYCRKPKGVSLRRFLFTPTLFAPLLSILLAPDAVDGPSRLRLPGLPAQGSTYGDSMPSSTREVGNPQGHRTYSILQQSVQKQSLPSVCIQVQKDLNACTEAHAGGCALMHTHTHTPLSTASGATPALPLPWLLTLSPLLVPSLPANRLPPCLCGCA